MTETMTVTLDELIQHVEDEFAENSDFTEHLVRQLRTWYTRGDGIAWYRSMDLHPKQAGRGTFASFGSEVSQFPGDAPPDPLPDFGATADNVTAVNWRYRLWAIVPRKKT